MFAHFNSLFVLNWHYAAERHEMRRAKKRMSFHARRACFFALAIRIDGVLLS